MHLYDPVYKNGSHLLVDIPLAAHVALRGQVPVLYLLHVTQYRATVLGHLLDIVLTCLVHVLNVLGLHLVNRDSPEVVQTLPDALLLLFQ